MLGFGKLTRQRVMVALVAGLGLALLAETASAASVSPIPQRGDVFCRNYTDGPGYTFRPVNTNGEFITPTGVSGRQGNAAIEYRYNPSANGGKGEFDWRLKAGNSAKINVVNLFARARSNTYNYGGFGIENDAGLQFARAPGRFFTKAVFCYGVGGDNPATIRAAPPLCRDATGILAGAEVLCPGGGEERVVFGFDPTDPNFGIRACTCEKRFRACDPAAPASQGNSCVSPTQAASLGGNGPGVRIDTNDGGQSTICLRGTNPLICYKKKKKKR